MRNRIIVFVLLALAALPVLGQADYSRQYQNAKDLFRQGQYNLAMESLKPLIAYDQKNQYAPYASFYYALAAHKQGYDAVAKDMLLQIKTVHARWDKIPEVNLWLATLYLQGKDYFQGFKILNDIEDKRLAETIRGLKRQHLAEITDAETLTMMLEEFPKDDVVARRLARVLAQDLADDESKKALEDIIDRFRFERSDFIPEAPKTFHKDRYSVAILLPFMLDELDASPGKKRNQIVLDFYEGIQLAVDSLNKNNAPQINLHTYDTDEGLDYLKRILNTDELKNADLVVGPLYSNENGIVQEFSIRQQVNTVNPFSNNTALIAGNPYAFLFQPPSEAIGTRAAEYIAARGRNNLSMVFYGPSEKDSVLAASFVEKATSLGVTVVASKRIGRDDDARIMEILATPTEFDEFNFPSQFTLKKDSIGSIYVATDDPLLYTKVISSIETRGDSILIVGSENWIDDTAVPFEKYQTLGVVFTAPNFVAVDNPRRKSFIRDFLQAYGKVPSKLSVLGYEMMLFFGHQLQANGVYFQDALNNSAFVPGHLFQGYDYQYSHGNQLVPLVTFRKGVVTLIDPRK